MTTAPEKTAEAARVNKYSLSIAGHRTSVSLEEIFWRELRTLARASGTTLPALVAAVDGRRGAANLSSALRVHVLQALLSRPPGPDHA